MFETDLTDQELLEQVVLFFRHRFEDYAPAQEYLMSRGLTDPELLENFQLGFADRELGRTLPKPTLVAGKAIRGQLQRIGICRPSGHGHFNGCITVPLRTATGEIANMYGRKVCRNQLKGTPLHMMLPHADRTCPSGEPVKPKFAVKIHASIGG